MRPCKLILYNFNSEAKVQTEVNTVVTYFDFDLTTEIESIRKILVKHWNKFRFEKYLKRKEQQRRTYFCFGNSRNLRWRSLIRYVRDHEMCTF